jgi:YesN/AraC family two-component response regulator
MLRVFIADDSLLIRERLAALVSGLEDTELVGQAGETPEAMEAIQRLKPDVVILDIHMPGGSGLQVLKTIKQAESAPVAIMLTAYSYSQYRRSCMQAGAEYFFDKSTEFNRVSQVLEQLRMAEENKAGLPSEE